MVRRNLKIEGLVTIQRSFDAEVSESKIVKRERRQ